jgi:hypothetical protein
MGLRTYDPSQVIVLWGGIPLSGFADGEFITIERSADAYSKVTGADGQTSRAKSCDKSGSAKVTLQQTSPANAVLQASATADELNNGGVVPFAVTDLSGTSVYVSAHAWVKKTPSVTFGKEIANREWEIDMADITVFTGGNADVE